MSNPCLIATNFRVPKTCRHEYLLFDRDRCIGTIWGVPGKKQVEQAFREPLPGVNMPLLQSRTLDWIQDSIEHLRRVCQ